MRLGKSLDQRLMGLQQTSPTRAGSKVGLEVMPIDSVTPGDGHDPENAHRPAIRFRLKGSH